MNDKRTHMHKTGKAGKTNEDVVEKVNPFIDIPE
jgi:hypothetical protein